MKCLRQIGVSTTITTGLLILLVLVELLTLAGCAGTGQREPASISAGLLGQTKQAVLACAGTPYKELSKGDTIIWKYYKKAPVFEESSVVSKESFP